MHVVRLEIVAVVMLSVLHGHSFAEETNVTDNTQRIQNATNGNSEQAARTLSYRIGNALSNQYREEHRDDQGIVRGSYGFRTPLGEFREVKYRADESGFRAHVVSNEPGVSQQNPADVQVRKVFSHPPSENLKQNQKLLVSEAYALQNNLPGERKSDQFANDPLVQELMRIMKIPFPLPKDKKESPENYDDHHIANVRHLTDGYRPAVVHNPITAQLPTDDHSTTDGYFPTGGYYSADDHHPTNYRHPIDVQLPANEYRSTSEHRPADDNRPTDDHRPSENHRQNDGHRLPDIYQENRKVVPGSSEMPLELEYLINLWRKQNDNLQTKGSGTHSFQEPMHQKFPGDSRPLMAKVPPFLLKEEKKQSSKEELPSLSEQFLDNSYHQRNNWVLGFIPFGIRTDKINEMVKKFSGDRNTQSESNDDTNSALFFNFKSSASPLNHINKKNCKVDGVPNSGAMTSHFVNGISTETPVLNPPGLKDVSEIRNNVEYGLAQGQSKHSEAEDNGIYMIQSIFAKRLAGLLGSSGIFPPHLLPHSNNKELNLPFPMYTYLKANRTVSEKSQQQAVENQPLHEKEKIDFVYTNPHSAQRWKELLSSVQPTSVSSSNTRFSPDTLFKSHSVVSSTNDVRIHNIGKRGENQSHHMLTPEKTDKGLQDKEQVEEFIMRNFFNGMMYSSNIKTNDQQDEIEDTNRDSMFNSFQRNRDTHNGRTRTSLNGDQPSILDLPPWSANQHRRFEIPPILRPLFDSKGVPVKPEDVPIHLHRFMPPKSQYSDSDRSFRFSIPRPVPPRSVVVPPKPPLTL